MSRRRSRAQNHLIRQHYYSFLVLAIFVLILFLSLTISNDAETGMLMLLIA